MQKAKLSSFLALLVLCLSQLSVAAPDSKGTAVDVANAGVIQSPQSLFSSIISVIMKLFYFVADQLTSLKKFLFPSLAPQTKEIAAVKIKDDEGGSSSILYYFSYIPAVCAISMVLFVY